MRLKAPDRMRRSKRLSQRADGEEVAGQFTEHCGTSREPPNESVRPQGPLAESGFTNHNTPSALVAPCSRICLRPNLTREVAVNDDDSHQCNSAAVRRLKPESCICRR